MTLPNPQEAQRRIAVIEAKLRHAAPIWRNSENKALFASSDGYFVVWDKSHQAPTVFVGISPDGEVIDLSGYPVDAGDIESAIDSLECAGLTAVKEKVVNWPRQHD
jgi:hypothetical protein